MIDILKDIKACRILPVIVINDVKNALPLANALLEGGINNIEITFRTKAAARAIEMIAKSLPQMIVGAGTIISDESLNSAVNSGAKFLVSPGINPYIVKRAKEKCVPIFPGCITPTEIEEAINLDLSIVKFFPSESFGGIKTIKALAAPYRDINFIPTGGIHLSNAKEYFAFDKVFAIGGSWMATEKMIDEERFDEITRLTKEAVKLSKE